LGRHCFAIKNGISNMRILPEMVASGSQKFALSCRLSGEHRNDDELLTENWKAENP
jgi:hypothetical protein